MDALLRGFPCKESYRLDVLLVRDVTFVVELVVSSYAVVIISSCFHREN